MKSIVEELFSISENEEKIIAIISVIISALGLIGFISSGKSKSEERAKQCCKRGILLFAVILSAAMICHSYITKRYVRVPNVVCETYQFAIHDLTKVGLKELGLSNVEKSFDDIVTSQRPSANDIVKVDSVVELVLKSKQKENTVNEQNDTPETPTTTEEELHIVIDSYELFSEGFYFSKEDNTKPGTMWHIDYSKGLRGTFHYSRELNETEIENWMHGGSLYLIRNDKRENVWDLGYNVSVFSDYDGVFAVEFPDNLPSGDYEFEMSHWIDGSYVIPAPIEFHFDGF